MSGSGLAILAAILGGTAQGLPKGMQQADELAQQDATRAQQQSQFDTQQARLGDQARAQNDQFREQQDRLMSAESARIAEGRDVRGAAQAETLRKESQERDRLGGLSSILAGQAQTMPTPERAEHEMPTVTDPGMLKLAEMIPMLSATERGGMLTDRFKTREPKAPSAPIQHDPTKALLSPDGTRTLIPAQPAEPKPPTGVYSRSDIENQLRLEGVKEGTLDWQRRYNDMARQYQVGPGAQVVGAGSREPIATGPPQSQALPAGEAAQNAELRTFIADLKSIGRTYDPAVGGPVQGRLGALRNMTGIGASASEADQRAQLQSFENRLLKLRSGAAVTPGEYVRIQGELPQITDPPVVFRAKLGRAVAASEEALANREREFTQRGFRGGQAPVPSPQPTGGWKIERVGP